MRIRVICMVVASATILTIPQSHAQTYDPNYPACMLVGEWGGTHINCSFTSIPQCQAAASGSGTCFANPYFLRQPKKPQSRGYWHG
jgi:hypothetical protein